MHDRADDPFVVVGESEGCVVLDRRSGRVVAEVADRWLADRWADELNAHERRRRRRRIDEIDEGEPPGQP